MSFEQCTLEEATHAESVTGEVYLISKSENRLRIVVEGYSIFNGTWKALGIKPLKEVKPKPIEFEAVFVKHDGEWRHLLTIDDGISIQNCKVARFRCVQILEEKK
jgi:hypothetical protein